MKLKASDVAKLVSGVVEGDKDSTISKLSKIENGDINSLSFLGNSKYSFFIQNIHFLFKIFIFFYSIF